MRTFFKNHEATIVTAMGVLVNLLQLAWLILH